MTKSEFLELLRNSLTGEIPDFEIENNIRFYDDYISNECRNKSEDMVMEQLGNPRLIAKTIIETYQISHGPIYNNMKHSSTDDATKYQEQNNPYEEHQSNNRNKASDRRDGHKDDEFYNKGNRSFYTPLNWLQKAILICIVVIIFMLFIFLGTIVLQLFVSYGLPILIIYFIIRSFKNRRY